MTEDVKDRRLPGGSLLSAYLDRQLMIWSDRGGASRHIGDRWAAHCSSWLDQTLQRHWRIPDADPICVTDILRLDDVEAVSREANHNHLENPDFLIFGARVESPEVAVILAIDAKFAADRIKPSQVSAQIVENLITIPPTGVTRGLVEDIVTARGFVESSIVDGAFLCPDSTLTEFLLGRRSRGVTSREPGPAIVRIAPEPGSMFQDIPSSQLVGQLARQDRLPVTPRDNLLSSLYYFRVACACVHLWQEQHMPLFSLHPPEPPQIGLISADLAQRATPEKSAYGLMMELVDEAEIVQRARQSVQNVASLPLRMAEIRKLIQPVGRDGEKQALRTLRRDLELEFRSRLFDAVGEIPADDPRKLGDILDDVGKATRELREHMHLFAQARAASLSDALPEARNG